MQLSHLFLTPPLLFFDGNTSCQGGFRLSVQAVTFSVEHAKGFEAVYRFAPAAMMSGSTGTISTLSWTTVSRSFRAQTVYTNVGRFYSWPVPARIPPTYI